MRYLVVEKEGTFGCVEEIDQTIERRFLNKEIDLFDMEERTARVWVDQLNDFAWVEIPGLNDITVG